MLTKCEQKSRQPCGTAVRVMRDVIWRNKMMKLSRISYLIICVLVVVWISSLLFAGDQSPFLDNISKKIHKETKEENDQNRKFMLRFSNVLGRKLMRVVNLDQVERIYIPYKTEISPEQISYLYQNAIFKEYEKLLPTHLAPTGTFRMLLENQTFLVFHTYAGAPMIRITWGVDEYWLELPNPKAFYDIGSDKEIEK